MKRPYLRHLPPAVLEDGTYVPDVWCVSWDPPSARARVWTPLRAVRRWWKWRKR